jgi:hypothetical protein
MALVVFIVVVVVVVSSEMLIKLCPYFYSLYKSFVLLNVKYICLCCVCNWRFRS